MNSNKTYETPSLEVMNIETEQMLAASVVEGSGASAGAQITRQNTDTIWL